MDKEDVIARFKTALPRRAEHSKGDVRICAAVLDINPETGRAREITRLSLKHES
jgi:calcineurin-like phosphoesterase